MKQFIFTKAKLHSVKTNLALYLVVGIIAVMLVPTFISNYLYSEKLKENALSSATYMIDQSAYDLQRFIDSVNNVIISLAGSEEVTHALSSKVVEYDTRALNNLLFYTQNYLLADVNTIDLIGENGKKFNLNLDISSKFNVTPNIIWLQDDFTGEEWYKQILQTNEPAWFPLHDLSYTHDTEFPVMDMGVCVRDIFTYRRIGIVHVELSPEALAAKIPGELGESGSIYLFDSKGGQISPAQPNNDGADIFKAVSPQLDSSANHAQHIAYGNQTLVFKQLPYGLSIVGVLSNAEIYADQTKALYYSFCISIVFTMLGIFIVFFVSNKVTYPLGRLVDAMRDVEKGNFVPLEINESDYTEMKELSRGFTRMTQRISQLVENMQVEQKKLEQERFRVLQFQINPHFLYNTLDSIIWLCKENRNDDTILMASSLMSFFRIALSDGRDFITIREEAEHVTSYLTIQKIRFKGKFSFSIIMEPEIEELYVNKLILQPVVENALYHGIQPSGSTGHISVVGYRLDKKIIFEISDNGIGIERERLERLKKRLDDNDHNTEFGIGLFNAHKRIQFLFGTEYGLSLQSEEHFGTTIRITTPVIKEAKDAKDFNS